MVPKSFFCLFFLFSGIGRGEVHPLNWDPNGLAGNEMDIKCHMRFFHICPKTQGSQRSFLERWALPTKRHLPETLSRHGEAQRGSGGNHKELRPISLTPKWSNTKGIKITHSIHVEIYWHDLTRQHCVHIFTNSFLKKRLGTLKKKWRAEMNFKLSENVPI